MRLIEYGIMATAIIYGIVRRTGAHVTYPEAATTPYLAIQQDPTSLLILEAAATQLTRFASARQAAILPLLSQTALLLQLPCLMLITERPLLMVRHLQQVAAMHSGLRQQPMM